MNKQTEALKLALERLEWFVDSYPHDITTSREEFLRPFNEALAEQPAQQEPVAWLKVIETPGGWGKFVEAKPHEKGAKPVYTPPPASKPWVGLTQEDVELLIATDPLPLPDSAPFPTDHEMDVAFVRQVEAKLKEKNNG